MARVRVHIHKRRKTFSVGLSFGWCCSTSFIAVDPPI